MKKVFIFDVTEIIDDPQAIMTYVPGQKLSECTYSDRIAEYEEDEYDDALDDLKYQKSTYYWDEEDCELEICERGLALCEFSNVCIVFKEKMVMSDIADNEINFARKYLKEVKQYG